MKKIEKWIDINGYEGLYKVSNKGRIFSNYKQKILKPAISGGGYLGVTLVKNKKRKTVQIHRIVAETFIENKNNHPCVNHKDGNKINNCVHNLEWVTYKENTKHAIESGLMKVNKTDHPMYGKKHKDKTRKLMSIAKTGKYGKLHPRSKPVAKVDIKTNRVINIYESQCIASKENNISQGNINMVLRGKRKTTGGFKWIYI